MDNKLSNDEKFVLKTINSLLDPTINVYKRVARTTLMMSICEYFVTMHNPLNERYGAGQPIANKIVDGMVEKGIIEYSKRGGNVYYNPNA